MDTINRNVLIVAAVGALAFVGWKIYKNESAKKINPAATKENTANTAEPRDAWQQKNWSIKKIMSFFTVLLSFAIGIMRFSTEIMQFIGA